PARTRTLPLSPYPTLFRSRMAGRTRAGGLPGGHADADVRRGVLRRRGDGAGGRLPAALVPQLRRSRLSLAGAADVAARLRGWCRSEEHTSELQSRENLVCR